MAWFRRTKSGIESDSKRKEIPDGMWTKCDKCGEIIHKKQLEQHAYTCPKCNFHFRIGSAEYIQILFDEKTFKEMDKKMMSADPLNFVDTRPYKERVKEAIKTTGLYDAVRTGTGKINGHNVVAAIMDFAFIGGSNGFSGWRKNCKSNSKINQNKIPTYNNFEKRWCQNDGRCFIANATCQNICYVNQAR